MDLLQIAGTITAVAGAVGVLVAGGRWVRARWAPVADFLEDWRGEPYRPGVPARPGVMERLERLEEAAEVVQQELTPNHGGSMRDRLVAVDARTRAADELLGQHLAWHRNEGHVDPTARVLLQHPDRDT